MNDTLLPVNYDESAMSEFVADVNGQVISLEQMMKDAGIFAEHHQARELCDMALVLLSARPFKSSYDPSKKAYFCTFTDEDEKRYTTVLGGGAVVPILDALIKTGFRSPLAVTLEFVEQGQNDGYYILK